MDNKNIYDVVIVGGGPAGLTSALYLARARYRVVVVEKEQFGGQITITSEIVNYPGVKLISGAELTETIRQQAESFGAEFLVANATKLTLDDDIKIVHTTKGDLKCFGIVIATGAYPRAIGFKGEDEFRGRGVAYCATCDGEFFTDKEIFVVGGGFAAAEESVFLTKFAKHITLLIRKEDFSCAESVSEKAKNHEKITILYNTEVESVSGDTELRSIRYRNNITGEVTEYKAKDGDTFGVFVFAGYEPETTLLRGLVNLNEQGYVITDNNRKTNIDGVYVAGDICEKNLHQVVTAVSDGAIVATELEKYVTAIQKKTGIIPEHKKSISDSHEKQNSKFFSEEIYTQLESVFKKMKKKLILKLFLDDNPISAELKSYIEEMVQCTENLYVEIADNSESEEYLPCVSICYDDGRKTGLAFHGVPSGHEFTSFVLGLYNASSAGQELDIQDKSDIECIKEPMHIQVLVTLSCTMCPELVTAVQRIAVENPNVSAEIYDVNYFKELREKYRIMSVPCLLVNGKVVSFGKKNLRQVLDILVE